MPFELPDRLNQTILYKRLESLLQDQNLSETTKKEIRKSITLVDQISDDAIQIMKLAPKNFSEYTLHDDRHLLSVTYLMGEILEVSNSLIRLSYIEITILLLSAYLHDIGMAPENKTIDEIFVSPEFLLFRQNRLYEYEGYKEILTLLENPSISIQEKTLYEMKKIDIEKGIFTEFLRQNHGSVGFEYIKTKWASDPRWEIEGYNIAETVAWVCKGHTVDIKNIEIDYSEKYPIEKLIGQNKLNILYCTLILRLADILDFDKKRTPKILFENISPKNEISLQEWNKHISVTGWSITNSRILFECECTHPVYEKSLRKFIDLIDNEIQNCKNIVFNFPGRDGILERYKLVLPNSVDRSKIFAKNNAYSYMDLSFSLSHDEIMKLLMGEDFWGGASLCIRELIQNAYDAIRHRRALEKAQGNDWKDGKITLTQRLNSDGYLEFECKDNGMGMDRHILKNYFFTVGRSYYRSPEFEQIRNDLKQRSVDFDPVSQFGIGVVSSFLIGKSLKIITQKYRGNYQNCGERLEIDVDGFSRLVSIKVVNNANPEPGTKITVIGNKIPIKEISADYWHDPLCLLGASQFYAAALDIPVEVIVESPFITSHEIIDPLPRPIRLKTVYELDLQIPSKNYTVIERDFSSMMEDCEGTARVFFLIDNFGKICLKNDWGFISFGEKCTKESSNITYDLIPYDPKEKIQNFYDCRSVLAQDGILVGLNDRKRSHLHHWGTHYSSPHFRFLGSYFLNLFGKSKLPLKPNRAPYHDRSPIRKEEKIWFQFHQHLNEFIGCTLINICENQCLNPDPDTLWSIIAIYRFSINGLEKKWAFTHIPIPCNMKNDSTKSMNWHTLAEMQSQKIQYLTVDSNTNGIQLCNSVNIPITGFNLEFCPDETIENDVKKIIQSSTILKRRDQQIFYELNPEKTPFTNISDTQYFKSQYNQINLQIYSDELNEFISINNPLKGSNYNHKAIQFLFKTKYQLDDQYKWLRWGVYSIANEIAQDTNFDEICPDQWNDDTIRKVSLALSHLEKVEWAIIPDHIKPPYKILYPRTGNIYEITTEFLSDKLDQTKKKSLKIIPEKIDLC
jgi:hypothetical protein